MTSNQQEWISKLIKTAKDCGIGVDLRYRDVESKKDACQWKDLDERATELTKIFDRTRLPNEIVVDFDNDDEGQNLQNIQKVEAVLKTESIPHFKNEYVNEEGKNSVHLHIIFRVSAKALEGGFSYDRYRDLFFNAILKKAGIEKEKSNVDVGLVKGKTHLVRELKDNFPAEVPLWVVEDKDIGKYVLITPQKEVRKKSEFNTALFIGISDILAHTLLKLD